LFYTLGGQEWQARPCRRARLSGLRTCARSISRGRAAMPAPTRRSSRMRCCARGGPATHGWSSLSGNCGAEDVGREVGASLEVEFRPRDKAEAGKG